MMLTKVNLFDKLSNVNVKMQKQKLCEGDTLAFIMFDMKGHL